jgi:hypothetical protein
MQPASFPGWWGGLGATRQHIERYVRLFGLRKPLSDPDFVRGKSDIHLYVTELSPESHSRSRRHFRGLWAPAAWGWT